MSAVPEAPEVVLAGLSWAACSIGMTLLNKLAVTKSGSAFGVVMVQMVVTCVAALATRKVHIGQGWKRWAFTVPILFFLMMITSMLALKYVSVGTFVVVRNLGPLVTLTAETAVHRPAAVSCDKYTVSALLCILLGVYFYEANDFEASWLGVGVLLINLLVGSMERLLQVSARPPARPPAC